MVLIFSFRTVSSSLNVPEPIKMRLVLVLSLVALAMTAPPPGTSDEGPQLLHYENNIHSGGDYKYSFAQSDGTLAEQVGTIKNKDQKNAFLSVRGSYSWESPDGVTYVVKYTADEGGYKAEVQEESGIDYRFSEGESAGQNTGVIGADTLAALFG